MNFVFRTQRMFVIPNFSFGPPGRVWYLCVFFPLLFFKTHLFSTSMPKISIPPPFPLHYLQRNWKKMGVCARNSEKSHFWIFPTSDVSVLWISPIVRVKCYNTPNNVLNYSSHMYTRFLRPYNFFKPKWLRVNFYNYSVLPSSQFSVNGSPTLIEGGRGMVGLFPPTPCLPPSFSEQTVLRERKFSIMFLPSRAKIFRNVPSHSIFPRSPYSSPPREDPGV